MEPSSKSISIYFQQGKRAPTLSGHVALHIKVCLSGRTCQDWSAQTEAESAAKLYWCNLYISIYELLLSLSLHCLLSFVTCHCMSLLSLSYSYSICNVYIYIYIYIIDIYTYIQILYIYTYLYIHTLLYVHYILYIYTSIFNSSSQLQVFPSACVHIFLTCGSKPMSSILSACVVFRPLDGWNDTDTDMFD